MGAANGTFLVAMGVIAIFAVQLAPFDPLEGHYDAIRQSPSTDTYYLGTDDLGRDVLSRLIHGARISLLVGFSSVAFGDAIGLVWGIFSGYVGGRFDLLSQRVLDILMAFPALILAMLLMVAFGLGLHTVVIAIGITRTGPAARIIRGVTLSVKEASYVDAARSVGVPPWRIMTHHIAPQCVAPFLVVVTAHIGIAIVAEASLSFLGVGVPPPTASWGNMLGEAVTQRFKPPWWMAVLPGAAITLTVLMANLFGDALRDFLDPRLRGRVR